MAVPKKLKSVWTRFLRFRERKHFRVLLDFWSVASGWSLAWALISSLGTVLSAAAWLIWGLDPLLVVILMANAVAVWWFQVRPATAAKLEAPVAPAPTRVMPAPTGQPALPDRPRHRPAGSSAQRSSTLNCERLLQLLEEGVGLLNRSSLAPGRFTIGPPSPRATDSEVAAWRANVEAELWGEPMRLVEFRKEPVPAQTPLARFGAAITAQHGPIHAQLAHRVPILEEIIKSACN